MAGIPSIHICLDFIPELLAQPQLEKQVKPARTPPGFNSLTFPRAGARLSLILCFFFVCFFKALLNMCPHRSLQSSCCHTCVPSTPYPNPSVWPGWPSVSWGPCSQVGKLFFLSSQLVCSLLNAPCLPVIIIEFASSRWIVYCKQQAACIQYI